jgi:hypothetical protein
MFAVVTFKAARLQVAGFVQGVSCQALSKSGHAAQKVILNNCVRIDRRGVHATDQKRQSGITHGLAKHAFVKTVGDDQVQGGEGSGARN